LTRAALPNFIIAGVSRAGTTTMFNALAAHPQVCSSTTKETRYFQAVRYGEPLAPLSEYQSYFRRCGAQPVTMECTPDYFYGGAATAAAIKSVCDPRIAIILREPISRLISFYRFMQSRLQIPQDMSLQQYVERCLAVPDADINDRANNVYTGLWGGQYARVLPDWLAAYPGRCDVYFFDDLVADPCGWRSTHTARWPGLRPRTPQPDIAVRPRSGSPPWPRSDRAPSSVATPRCTPGAGRSTRRSTSATGRPSPSRRLPVVS
jgi:hypothetical protein